MLGQQVFFAQRNFDPGSELRVSMDGWDGDVHRHYANDLKADFDDPAWATVGVELVCSSITSNGNGSDRTTATDNQLAENPHIRFASSQGGCVSTRFTAAQLRADLQILPCVTTPGAPMSTRASLAVEDGVPGLNPRLTNATATLHLGLLRDGPGVHWSPN